MRNIKKTAILLLTAVAMAAFSGCSAFEAAAYNGGEIEICAPTVADYLALPSADALSFIRNNCYKATKRPLDRQTLTLSWRGGKSPYTFTIAASADFSDAETVVTTKSSFAPACLIPGIRYYWKVKDAGDNETSADSFVPAGVRWVNARAGADENGVNNVRDLGGWSTEDGKRVKYGMLYRGGALRHAPKNTILDEFGRDVLENKLGIKTEIDLRNRNDDGGQVSSELSGCSYIKAPFTAYTSILSTEVFEDNTYYDPATCDSLQEIFDELGGPETYPAYFHCQIGQDRTGTLAYLIGGLLGVSFKDLTRDYELTAFSKVGTMDREAPFSIYNPDKKKTLTCKKAWITMHKIISSAYAAPSGKLSDAIAKYLTDFIGVSHDTINAIRELLLE